jgi:hypothetical protein
MPHNSINIWQSHAKLLHDFWDKLVRFHAQSLRQSLMVPLQKSAGEVWMNLRLYIDHVEYSHMQGWSKLY